MITLRCTRRAAGIFGVSPIRDCPSGTSPLGDWYVNLVPTVGGGFFVYTNERTLLSVFHPRQDDLAQAMPAFVRRVGNILSMIGVPNWRIEEEIEHFRELRYAKTASRKVLGIMNDYAYRLDRALGEATPAKKVSLSDFELAMADMPQATLAWGSAREAALDLMNDRSQFGAV
jgi:hypothetical protein